MNFVRFKQANTLMQAAEKDRSWVQDIPAYVGPMQYQDFTIPVILYAFRPTPAELADLNAGELLFMQLCMKGSPPPVSLLTNNPFEPPKRIIVSDEFAQAANQGIMDLAAKVDQDTFEKVLLAIGEASVSEGEALVNIAVGLCEWIGDKMKKTFDSEVEFLKARIVQQDKMLKTYEKNAGIFHGPNGNYRESLAILEKHLAGMENNRLNYKDQNSAAYLTLTAEIDRLKFLIKATVLINETKKTT